MKFTLFALLSVLLLFAFITQLPDGKLHIYMCDVGQGDAILITYKTSQVLIDAGPNNSVQTCLSTHLPFWDRTIEAVVVTHADSDHVFGFPKVFERFTVERVFITQIDSPTEVYQDVKKAILESNARVYDAHLGQEMSIGEVKFKVLFPTHNFIEAYSESVNTTSQIGTRTTKKDRNDFSVVLSVTHGQFSALFTGDTTEFAERAMLQDNLVPSAYFLKVPHHGSRNNLLQPFLSAVSPVVSGISAGEKNRYGHPHQEILNLLEQQNSTILRTDMHGESEIATDGRRIWVSQ